LTRASSERAAFRSSPKRIMWQAALLAAAAVALLPGLALGGSIDDYTVLNLDQEARLEDKDELVLEHELDHEAHHRHHVHHGHHRHHRKHFLSNRGASLLSAPFPAELPQSRHHLVAKKLQRMDEELRNIKSQRHVAAHARSNLEGEVKKALKHINNVVSIKSQLAHTEVQIRSEERKLRRLEDDRIRLDATHHSLVSSLHHVMEPKIVFAEERLKVRKKQLKVLQDRAKRWREKESELKTDSVAMLEARTKSKEHVAESAAAEEKAHKEWIKAEKELLTAKKSANLDIGKYKFSQAEARAAMTKEKQGEEESREAAASVNRLTHILNMESSRVDESMAIGKDRVLGKIKQLEARKAKSSTKHQTLQHQYAEWRIVNQDWATHLDSNKRITQTAAQNYADAQREVLDAASDKVASDAEDDSDWAWNDWARE